VCVCVCVCVCRPRLGNSLHHVVLVGAVYLVVGSFEGIRRVITVITAVMCSSVCNYNGFV